MEANVSTLDIVERLLKLAGGLLVIVMAGIAFVRWVYGRGGKDKDVEKTIEVGFREVKQEFASAIAGVQASVTTLGAQMTSGLSAVNARMDRVESRAAEEAKERAARDAVENERRIREAIEDTKDTERAKAIEIAINDLSDSVEKHFEEDDQRHAVLHDRVTKVEAAADRLRDEQSRLGTKVHQTSNDLQKIELRLARTEKASSGNIPAIRDPRRDNG